MQCPTDSRKFIRDLLLNEMFHYIPVKHEQPMFQKLWDISKAVKEQKNIKIQYLKENQWKPVSRNIEPLGIMFSEFYFYLIGYISNYGYDMPIVYGVDRIQDYKISVERFKIPESMRFEEGEFRKRVQFMNPGKLIKIKFRFNGPSIDAVLDRLPTARIVQREEHCAIIEAEVYGKGIKMWLLVKLNF